MGRLKSGDIVECIDDVPSRAESKVMPTRGRLYTLSAVRWVGDGASVRLKELVPTCHLGGPCGCGQCGWDAGRFRKIYRPGGALLTELTQGVRERL
jgi:hypothetical protein